MKVYVEVEEYCPFRMVREVPESWATTRFRKYHHEVTDEKMAEWKRVMAAFEKMQNELKRLDRS